MNQVNNSGDPLSPLFPLLGFLLLLLSFYGCGQVINGKGNIDIDQLTNISPPVKNTLFKGKITDSKTGKGIPFARISSDRLTGITDESGIYNFSNFPIGKNSLKIFKEGYQTELFDLFLEIGENIFEFSLDPDSNTFINNPDDFSDFQPGSSGTNNPGTTTTTTSTSSTTTAPTTNNRGAVRGKVLPPVDFQGLIPTGRVLVGSQTFGFLQNGSYFVQNILPGFYDIRLEPTQFPAQTIGNFEVRAQKVRNIADYTLKSSQELILSGWTLIRSQVFATAEDFFRKLELDPATTPNEKKQGEIGRGFAVLRQSRFTEAKTIFDSGLGVTGQEDRTRARFGLALSLLEVAQTQGQPLQKSLGLEALSQLEFIGIGSLDFRWPATDLLRTSQILFAGDEHAVIAYAYFLTDDLTNAQSHFNLAKTLGSVITFGLNF